MRVKTKASEAKEQKTGKRETKQEELARLFNEKCGRRQLDELEAARDYFDGLDAKSQTLIRAYAASEGEIDLNEFSERLKSIYPSGTAGRVGKLMLEYWVSRQLTLAEQESGLKSYLNAKGDRKT